jgi:hypothetical protein
MREGWNQARDPENMNSRLYAGTFFYASGV